jgi:hypothetical protein
MKSNMPPPKAKMPEHTDKALIFMILRPNVQDRRKRPSQTLTGGRHFQ